MWVTIYTDASHMPSTNKGTWAFWIRWEFGRIIKSGKFKDEITDSNKAEIRCILNAIYIAKKSIVDQIKGIVIVTDSKNAIQMLSFRKKKPNVLMKFAPELFTFDMMVKGLDIKFKHIKGHRGGRTMQSYINEQCDKMARKAHKQ